MNRYEILYILPSTLTEKEVPDEAIKIINLLKQNGAEIIKEVDLEKKKLAYPIKKQRYGYYRLVEFTAEPTTINKLNDALRLSQDLLRHLIVEKPVKSQVTLDKEQALRDRLAARRQRAETEKVTATTIPSAPTETPISADELDKKLSEILEENTEV